MPNIRIWAEFKISGMHRHLLATYQPKFIFTYIMYKYQHYAYWESKQAVYDSKFGTYHLSPNHLFKKLVNPFIFTSTSLWAV